jgi:sigma-B regulation protein RsbU (phosphoserine phosphatase)
VRQTPELEGTYVIMVTAQEGSEYLIAGLEAGANDYVTKPVNQAELRARVQVAERVLELQGNLAARVRELEAAIAELKQLRGILPICCYCKNIRNDAKYWQRVEDYLVEHADVDFSHGICPNCWETVVNPQMEEMWGCRLPYEEA